jgi:hypothetical protein
MKKILFLSAAMFLLASSFASTDVVVKPSVVKASEIFIPIGNTGQKISLLDLSRMSIKDVQQFTGKKMKLADRMMFKAAQRQLKKNINPDGTLDKNRIAKNLKKASDGTTGFHIGGFALGFLLGLIGVLIAYLINDDKKSNRVKWAWIGLAIWVVIVIIAVAV